MPEQRADATELEALLHVDIDIGPALEIQRHHLEQSHSLVALHADTQGAALALRVLLHARLGLFELRQQTVRESQQVLPRLRETHEAVFARPYGCTQLLLHLLDRTTQCRLREMQRVGRGGERPYRPTSRTTIR